MNERVLEAGEPIPPSAVVVTGNRPVSGSLPWAAKMGLTLRCAMIIKYKDAKTSAALELESVLR